MSGADDLLSSLRPNWKLWLEHDGQYVFGPGAYAILKSVMETGSIRAGADALGMSYRYAWGVIKRIERKTGLRLLETRRGGRAGGGGAEVTEAGLQLVRFYSQLHQAFERAASRLAH